MVAETVCQDEDAEAVLPEPEGPPNLPANALAPVEVEAPAAPPAGRAARREVSARGKSEQTVSVPGGRVSFYRKGNFFQATCSNPAHLPKCVLSRSAEEGRKPSQGRPLGFLVAWLAKGAELPDKSSHWNKDHWPSHEERLACRRQLAVVEGGEGLLLSERVQRPDEGEEPEAIP